MIEKKPHSLFGHDMFYSMKLSFSICYHNIFQLHENEGETTEDVLSKQREGAEALSEFRTC